MDLESNRTYTANGLNQYTNIVEGAGGFLPQFDDDGNQTLIKTATGVWQVTYNGENRPVLWECGTTNITMKYDRMGRRVEYLETVTDSTGGPSAVSATTNAHHRFVYDGYLCVQRLNAAANNAVDIAFGWDPTEPVATRPLWMQRVSGSYNFFYFHDGNKNVSDLVSYQSARGIPAHYEYAPFGMVTATTTNTAFTAFNVTAANPYRFSSEYADGVLGLVYYNYRHYEPVAGRWVARDLLPSPNKYCFVGNRSTDDIDLFGLKKCYRWMLITFYTGQKPAERNSWNKKDLTEMDAAVGLAGWSYATNKVVKTGVSKGRDDYAYEPGTQFVIYRGRKKNSGGDSRTVRDGGSGWVIPRPGAPSGVDRDEWLDLWTASKNPKNKGIEIDLVEMEVKNGCPCPKGWSDKKNVTVPENLKKIQEAISK